MKILSVEVEPLDLKLQTALTVAYGSYPVLEYALLKIHTDNGLIGLGEASPDPEVTGETQQSIIAALKKAGEFLKGKDPFSIEEIIRLCLDQIPQDPAAIAAVDMALYDLQGKALNVPVFQLLGGRTRPGIGLYPVIPMDEPEVMAGFAKKFTDMGADTLKVKLGSDPFTDLMRVKEIERAAGRDVKLRLDINQGWKDASSAIEAIKLLEAYNIEWIEQPVKASDIAGMAAVTAAVEIPIMADESAHNSGDIIRIACEKAADIINIKLMKCGGIYRAAEMLAVAEAAGLRCILGSMGESSIGSAAGLHFAVAKSGITAAELIGPAFILNDPAVGYSLDPATFSAVPSDAPGLGVELK